MVGKRLVRKLSGLNGATLHVQGSPPPLSPRGGWTGASSTGTLAGGVFSFISPDVSNVSPRSSKREPAVAQTAATQDKALVAKLLTQFKQTSEVRQYLKLFGSVESTRFAIVKISGDVLTSSEETAKVGRVLYVRPPSCSRTLNSFPCYVSGCLESRLSPQNGTCPDRCAWCRPLLGPPGRRGPRCGGWKRLAAAGCGAGGHGT